MDALTCRLLRHVPRDVVRAIDSVHVQLLQWQDVSIGGGHQLAKIKACLSGVHSKQSFLSAMDLQGTSARHVKGDEDAWTHLREDP